MKDDWRFKDFGKSKLPSRPGFTNAASRVIPSPSGTNWNSTFLQNNAASTSATDWNAKFGGETSELINPPQGMRAFIGQRGETHYDINRSSVDSRGRLTVDSRAALSESEISSRNANESFFQSGNVSSPSGTNWGETFGDDTSAFYQDRAANMELSPTDLQQYSAGDDYGFTNDDDY